jgi:hypothetical protein
MVSLIFSLDDPAGVPVALDDRRTLAALRCRIKHRAAKS